MTYYDDTSDYLRSVLSPKTFEIDNGNARQHSKDKAHTDEQLTFDTGVASFDEPTSDRTRPTYADAVRGAGHRYLR